jgi:hypothetical protein
MKKFEDFIVEARAKDPNFKDEYLKGYSYEELMNDLMKFHTSARLDLPRHPTVDQLQEFTEKWIKNKFFE